jgi:hypothetical protein
VNEPVAESSTPERPGAVTNDAETNDAAGDNTAQQDAAPNVAETAPEQPIAAPESP